MWSDKVQLGRNYWQGDFFTAVHVNLPSTRKIPTQSIHLPCSWPQICDCNFSNICILPDFKIGESCFSVLQARFKDQSLASVCMDEQGGNVHICVHNGGLDCFLKSFPFRQSFCDLRGISILLFVRIALTDCINFCSKEHYYCSTAESHWSRHSGQNAG